MHAEDITPAVVVPRERSEDQGILLKHMSQLNQRLLGPWETADGQRLPRLTLAEAVAQLYEWSTAYRDHPELARFCRDGGPSGTASPVGWPSERLTLLAVSTSLLEWEAGRGR